MNDINYGGDIALKDFGLKVNFNGVDYTFADATVLLQNGNILVTEPVKLGTEEIILRERFHWRRLI